MTYQEFVVRPEARQRYWARSHLGWSRMGAPRRTRAPGPGRVDPELLITQNVDGLHEAAGSRRSSPCTAGSPTCLPVLPRTSSRAPLATAWSPRTRATRAHATVESRPDGDVELDDTADFAVPAASAAAACSSPTSCSSARTSRPPGARCYDAVDALTPDGALLVVGSSLTVMSGFRFVRRAAKAGVPW
jgi:hypothetical protein